MSRQRFGVTRQTPSSVRELLGMRAIRMFVAAEVVVVLVGALVTRQFFQP